MSAIPHCLKTRNNKLRRDSVSRSRRGSTLLEIMLATTILLVAMTAIGNQCRVGIHAGIRAQMESEAIWHCQTLLQETIASVDRKSVSKPTPIPCHEDWLYTLELQNGPMPGLEKVDAQVWKPGKYENLSRIHLTQFVSKNSSSLTNIGPKVGP